MLDAIVIGAGPAGNQAAIKLSGRGHSVLVLDYRSNIGDKLCTGIIGRECAERFELPDRFVYHRAKSVTICPALGDPVRVSREREHAYVVDRVGFVAHLADRAMRAGSEYRLRRRVTGLDVLQDRVRISANGPDGAETHEARAAVIASGYSTGLAKLAGLQPAPKGAFAAQVPLRGLALDEVKVFLRGPLPRGYFGWLVPAGPDRALAGVLGRERSSRALPQLLDAIRKDGTRFRADGSAMSWGVPLKPAARTYAHRILLAGDAAGQVKPTTGGGIYYSLLSGELAADALADALDEDDLNERSLKRYELAWKSKLGRELRVGYIARAIYERMNDRSIGSIVRIAASNGILSEHVSFDWHADIVTRGLKYPRFDSILAPFRETNRAGVSGNGK